ncbi:tyrosine-type recombinase/integrase [Dyadobacter fanqingshengii]|uniref:Tyrosine recombinase XerC n=1 Tax=Dyadobacter fanqingshengii TaxID=2906443 RepID=A0A9X1TCI1_9BACT|nr:tyrosine-type recombinase/integrase [Dyadobacter fanqingshengii]MCF0043593.1 tyrosine-type recombinase/integrase [Dyadobacter fanqingshengii]USJ34790.1 tyrosine-type recombinase/integrase [Dyadobacter fanqingshengii]
MITLFIDFLKFEKRASVHTIKSYQTDLDQFQKYLLFQYELDKPQEAKAPMLRSWVVSLMEEGMNPSSINRKIASLRTFFGFLKRKNAISQDPTKILSALKTRKKLPAFVEEKSMEMLFQPDTFTEDFEGVRDRTIMELLYGSGIRLAELVSLEINDLNLPARTIRVFGKRSKERVVPISTSLANLLFQYLTLRAPEEDTNVLILTNSGKAVYPVFVQRTVGKYLSAVTTLSQKSPHVLRHTYATHLLNRGADLNAIKELLGHANLAATQIYTHNSIEKLKKTHQQAHPKA